MAESYNGILGIEIDNIVNTKNTKTNTVEYKFILHTPKSDIDITLPVAVETLRNYNRNAFDYTVATFLMFAGDFLKDVMPYRDILELTVRSYDTVSLKRETTRYRFVLLSNNDNMYGGYNSSLSKEQLNKVGQFTIAGQCIDREVEALRSSYISGVFRNSTVKNALISGLVEASKKVAIEGKKLELNCEVVEPNNDYTYNHIVIPDGPKFFKFPTLLQEGDYGVYNGGIGTYYQKHNGNPCIFVYPLFDKTLFEKSTKRLMIYRTDSRRLSYLENTYAVDGDLVKMIAGIEIDNSDDGGTELMNSGDGIVASDPSMLTKRNVDISDSQATVSASNQITGSKVGDRRDGVNNAEFVGNEGNLYIHRSNINMKKSTNYQVTWNFADPSLIFPGMPVCIKYKDKEKGVVKLYGNVQGIYYKYDFAHKTTSALLYLAVTRPIDLETT